MIDTHDIDIAVKIRHYFERATDYELADNDDIFELGLVDSLFALQLVLFVEKSFGLAVERDDLDLDNFLSIAALTRFVRTKIIAAKDDQGR